MSLHFPILDAETAVGRLRTYLEDGELRKFSDIEGAVGPNAQTAIDTLFDRGEISIIRAADTSFFQRASPTT